MDDQVEGEDEVMKEIPMAIKEHIDRMERLDAIAHFLDFLAKTGNRAAEENTMRHKEYLSYSTLNSFTGSF